MNCGVHCILKISQLTDTNDRHRNTETLFGELLGVLWPSAALRVVVVVVLLFATDLHWGCTKVEDGIMCLWGNARALCEQSPVNTALPSMRLLHSERNELPSINDWLLLLYFPEEMESSETFNRALQSSKCVSLECKGLANKDADTHWRICQATNLAVIFYSELYSNKSQMLLFSHVSVK